jgi:hypothetical protein
MTRTKCPIVMEKVFKNQNFGLLIEYGPHSINFTIFTFVSEKEDTVKAYIKFRTKLFHLT